MCSAAVVADSSACKYRPLRWSLASIDYNITLVLWKSTLVCVYFISVLLLFLTVAGFLSAGNVLSAGRLLPAAAETAGDAGGRRQQRRRSRPYEA